MARPRVLVIDDSPDVHALLRVRLAPEDIELLAASSAAEGLTLAELELPDLVLLDVDLPDGNGFAACRTLKEREATSHLPVIFLSGSTSVEAKVEGFDVGGIDYVTKPFEPAELRARVRAALRTKRYQDLLARHAQMDALTGLWNRRHFESRLGAELTSAARHGRPLGLLLLDIDHFKRVNDTYGHPFGDRVIQTVAERVAERVRPRDVACRIGGEELAVLLPETQAETVLAIAERLRVHLAGTRLPFGRESVSITVSVGVVDSAIASCDPGALLAAADAALYRAKHGGRNRVEVGVRADPSSVAA
jgi:two-component system cell cycle response regulator